MTRHHLIWLFSALQHITPLCKSGLVQQLLPARIQPVECWHCLRLGQGADLHMLSWCHCHSLSLAPVNADWFYFPGFTFLVPAHPESKRAVKRLCVLCVLVYINLYIASALSLVMFVCSSCTVCSHGCRQVDTVDWQHWCSIRTERLCPVCCSCHSSFSILLSITAKLWALLHTTCCYVQCSSWRNVLWSTGRDCSEWMASTNIDLFLTRARASWVAFIRQPPECPDSSPPTKRIWVLLILQMALHKSALPTADCGQLTLVTLLCLIHVIYLTMLWTITHTHTHTHKTILHPSWILSRTTRVSRHQKGKTNLDLLEQEIVSGSGISWAICKSAHCHASVPPLSFLQAGCPSCCSPGWSRTYSRRAVKRLCVLWTINVPFIGANCVKHLAVVNHYRHRLFSIYKYTTDDVILVEKNFM